MIGHGVGACCEACTGIVGGKALAGGHLLQGHWVWAGERAVHISQERTNGAASFFHLPQSIAPVFDFAKRVERADPGKCDKFLPAESWHSPGQVVDGNKWSVNIPRRENLALLTSSVHGYCVRQKTG